MNSLRRIRVAAAAVVVGLACHSARGDDTTVPAASPPPPQDTPGVVHEGVLTLMSPDKVQITAGSPDYAGRTYNNVMLYIDSKKVKAAYLGVYINSADGTLQSQLGLPDGVGLVVAGLDDSGPAKQAGLREHDVIYKIGDQIAVNPAQFEVLVRMHKPGEAVELTIYRQAKQMTVSATLVEKEVPALGSAGEGTSTIRFENAKGLSSAPGMTFTPFAGNPRGAGGNNAITVPSVPPGAI